MHLDIRDLSLTYRGGVRALDQVSLSLDNGLFGLLGPNGAGKSSLMRILATLQQADSGSITFKGLDILANPEEHRRHLGYLPQDFGVYPGISARDLLEHLALLKGITNRYTRRDQVDSLLRKVNLWDERGRAVHGFSGGMRQRFGIAQALLGEPKLVIVDEPTAGLDPEERNRFLNLLSEIGENVVVILSTHIVEDVRQLCPSIGILRSGRLVEMGTPAVLIRALEGQVWQRAIARDDLDQYRRTHTVLSSQLSTGRLSVRVLSEFDPGFGFESVAPTLEDVYFTALSRQPAAA